MKIGIIGGGQLGMMMAEEATLLGHTIISLDPNEACPLSKLSALHITADYDDEKAFRRLCSLSDVVTYEFENVNVDLVETFIDRIPQKAKALYVTQNRLREKSFVQSLGIPTPFFEEFTDGKSISIPSIVKTCSGGYDGKGQYPILHKNDIDQLDLNQEIQYIVEEKIQFDFEISVVLTRDTFDQIVVYPITKNMHRNGILFISKTNFDLSKVVEQKALEYATKIVRNLDYIGTFAVEFFVRGDEVIFNEYAPRPHNSGHNTIEGCTTSQFKNHILAITNQHVLPVTKVAHNAMVNILGQDMVFIQRAKDFKECYTHMYFKEENKHNRKMGHITIVSPDERKVDQIIDTITKESL